MTTFPKLRYPINTKHLVGVERNILLAYDIIYKARQKALASMDTDEDYKHDLSANLANLGNYIENTICGGDMALRFEGYDDSPITTDPIFDQPAEVVKESWTEITNKEVGKSYETVEVFDESPGLDLDYNSLANAVNFIKENEK